ncbi:MAG: ribosomal protein L7/L12 [Polyangiaceae bacterium]
MPSDHRCRDCDFRYSIGWFHYHDFSSGYVAATLLVCAACGAQHYVESAERQFEPSPTFGILVTKIRAQARVAVMRALRVDYGCSMEEAQRALSSPPIELGSKLSREDADRLAAELTGRGCDVELVASSDARGKNFGAVRRDRLLLSSEPPTELEVRGRDEASQEFELEQQACGRCDAVGQLVAEAEKAPQRCPKCGASVETVGAWIT